MARPTKCRKVCKAPITEAFIPSGGCNHCASVTLTVDEYEAIRLIDKEGHSQEDTARQMSVSRTTVQKIYDNARRKLATAIVDGHAIRIEGGDYSLCDGNASHCLHGVCHRAAIITDVSN